MKVSLLWRSATRSLVRAGRAIGIPDKHAQLVRSDIAFDRGPTQSFVIGRTLRPRTQIDAANSECEAGLRGAVDQRGADAAMTCLRLDPHRGDPRRRRSPGRSCRAGLLRARHRPRLSVRAAKDVQLLRRAGLDHLRTEGRAASSERVCPGRHSASRQNQFAAMKIDRPKPVRWCSA